MTGFKWYANTPLLIERDESQCGCPPGYLAEILEKIPSEVMSQFSGCGSPIPESVEKCRVLDLGCGTGRDVFLCSALTGPGGYVMGLDTEKESLTIARKNIEAMMGRFGYSEPNVAFRQGSIEAMGDAGLGDEDFDVIISNRALGFVSDKRKVLKEVHRLLKTGGEFYFSDHSCDRRLTPELKEKIATSERDLGGAMYIGDFIRLARKSGFSDPRIVGACRLNLGEWEEEHLCGASFIAVTFRLFKIRAMEDGEEDYGQAAVYNGGVNGFPTCFKLDMLNLFEKGRATRVGGNTALILQQSRYAKYFDITGDRTVHFGPFTTKATKG